MDFGIVRKNHESSDFLRLSPKWFKNQLKSAPVRNYKKIDCFSFYFEFFCFILDWIIFLIHFRRFFFFLRVESKNFRFSRYNSFEFNEKFSPRDFSLIQSIKSRYRGVFWPHSRWFHNFVILVATCTLMMRLWVLLISHISRQFCLLFLLHISSRRFFCAHIDFDSYFLALHVFVFFAENQSWKAKYYFYWCNLSKRKHNVRSWPSLIIKNIGHPHRKTRRRFSSCCRGSEAVKVAESWSVRLWRMTSNKRWHFQCENPF